MNFDEARKYAGGRSTDLADLLGVSTQVIGNWKKRGIPADAQWELEYISLGALRATKRPHVVAMRAKIKRATAAA